MKRRTFIESAAAITTLSALPAGYIFARDNLPDGVSAVTLDGKEITLSPGDIKALDAGFKGALLLAGDKHYDTHRKIWNGMFDKHPALIARCANTADVARAVEFAGAFELLTSVRCGGHSFSGKSVCDRGLMIDLTLMKGVDVDQENRSVRVDGGVLLGEMDRETQKYALATTAGTVSHTGAGGLTLGGGYGRMSRKYKLACDNLLEVEVVTADGSVLTANDEENQDLFWAVRGGGGNFGVVTSFTFRLHEIGPVVYGGRMSFPFSQAREILNFYSEYAHDAPDEVFGGGGVAINANGEPSFGISYNYCGNPGDGEKALEPLRKFRKPLTDTCKAVPYLALQTSSDVNWPHGRNYYMKSGFIRKIETAVIDEVIERYTANPHRIVRTVFYQVGGAANRVARDATAYWQRDPEFDVMIFAGWDGPVSAQQNSENIEMVREHWYGMEPHVKGTYLNSEAEDNLDKVRRTYGDNYERLVQIKTKYDPANLFRMNSNIRPKNL